MWFDIKEKTPIISNKWDVNSEDYDKETFYLVFRSNGVCSIASFAKWDEDEDPRWYLNDREYLEIDNVTHFQELSTPETFCFEEEIVWEANPSNQGFQELVSNSNDLHVILRNSKRQSSDIRKFKVLIREII